VLVELQLGQQIDRGDADERAGGKGQGRAQKRRSCFSEVAGAELKQYHAERNGEGKEPVHRVARHPGPAARGHESADGHRIKRLVQDDHQERAQAQEEAPPVAVPFRGHARRQGDPVDQRVQGQPESGAAPRQPAGRFLRQRAPVMRVVTGLMIFPGLSAMPGFVQFRCLLGDIVVMKMEEALDEEHHQEPAQQPPGSAVDRTELMPGVGQHVQHPDAEHQAGHETGGHLQPGVREPHHQRNPSPGQRGEQDQQAIACQQRAGRHP